MSAKIFTMPGSETDSHGAFVEPLLAKQVGNIYNVQERQLIFTDLEVGEVDRGKEEQ